MRRRKQSFLNKLMMMGIVLVSMPVFALPVVFAQGPTLQSTSPISNATGVALTSTVTATYDRNMDSTTVTSRTFAVHAMQSGWLTETLSVSGGDITLSPRNAFKPGELVQVSATTGTLSITGTGPIAPYVWQFRAAAGVGPATFPISATFGVGNSYAVALGDLNGDGNLDALIANINGQAQEVWLNDGTGNFGTAAYTTFGAGDSRSVALGDLDGDGDLDAVIANLSAAQEVWLNDGAGNFGTVAYDTFGAGASMSVVLGDLNGDGTLDALIANYNGAQEVWLNDGTGNFGATAYDTFGGGASYAVVLGDLNGDGNLDALIANSVGQAQEVWLNDGTGKFGAAAYDTFGAGNSLSVALGDLDGDGDLDALIANYFGAQEVWLNDGTGNFGTAAHDAFGAGYSTSVALGDLDGDGDLDALIANDSSQAQEVWLNDGTGNFGAAAHDSFGAGYSTSVALGDLDGDGDLDAVIANFSAAQEAWLNDGPEMNVQGNGLSIPAGTTTPATANGTDFGTVMGGDAVTRTFTISNAGNLDLTLNGSPAVTLSGGAPFSITVQPSSPVISHSTTTFDITFAPSMAGSFTDTVTIPNNDANENPYTFVIAGTGTPSVLAVTPAANSHNAPLNATLSITFGLAIQANSLSTQTVVVHGGGHGRIDGAVNAVSTDTVRYTPTGNFFPGEAVQTSVTSGVLAAGGAPVAPYVWQFRAAAGVGPATFPISSTFGAGNSKAIALGDLNGDGNLDALIANSSGQAQEVWLNDGTGNFGATAHDTFGAGYSLSAALGDLDGDGDLDALIANYTQAQEVWLNDGTGNFGATAYNTFGAGDSTSIALGDLDGDGDLDALIANINGAQEVWLNDGTGNFGATAYDTFGAGYSTSVALGDLDGDGDLDALIANYNSQTQEVWLNNGTGNFGATAHDTFGASDSMLVALGDLDGDGDLDALVANDNNQAQEVWLNDGAGNFGTTAYDAFGGGYSASVALGDLDGDGDLDTLIANDYGQAQEVWLNDGTGNFGAAAHDTFGTGDSTSAALGDLDGDGDLDALIANSGQAQEVRLNDGPEMDVQGNGLSIPAGTTTPATANGTDFGTVMGGDTVTRTFTISNAGNLDLTLSGSPAVTLTGGAPFSVTTQPASPVISHSTTAFDITFAPSMVGSFTDTVTIPNNDANENPYTFVISGTGVPPTSTLTVNIIGSGRVDLAPPGTHSGDTANFSSVFTTGTVVTMTATANTGWRFDGWSGDASGSTPFALLMDSLKTVTATFSTHRIYLPLVLKQ